MYSYRKTTSWISWCLSNKKRKLILHSLAAYKADLSRLKDQYITFSDRQRFSERWKWTVERIKTARIPHIVKSLEPIRIFQQTDKGIDATLTSMNIEFIQRESQRCNLLLSNIDGKSLDYQQRTVVICDEDRSLVLAGAGSGKTLTISGKVKYLCSEKGISPEDILLISFTNKAAEEMTTRISEKLHIPVQAVTFHKLGLDIISAAQGKKPDIDDDLDSFIQTYFENYIANNSEAIESIVKFFAYYLNIPAELSNYSSLEEAFYSEKESDLETLKSKHYHANFTDTAATDWCVTLQSEKVKSQAEVMIANFLFLNGIRYEYERKYPFETADLEHRQYKPDFYLPDYDLYIEHFGIDRQSHAKWLAPAKEQVYLSGIYWKRATHKRNNTRLLETYSYYCKEGCLLEKLSELLIKNGVKFSKPDYSAIFHAIYAKKSNTYFSYFINLCSAFIILFKSNGYTSTNHAGLSFQNSNYETPFYVRRTETFLSIITPIIKSYEEHLSANNSVDFPDMINQAALLVKGGYKVHPYKWVIIDEYQDISVARYKLTKAILDQTGAKLLCVGDDWQSIYRFSGSDISLFTDFENYFGKTEIMKIEKTYRNSQELIDATSHFVMQNPAQLKKQLQSDKHLGSPIVFCTFERNPSSVLKQVIDRIIAGSGEKSSILLLGRTNYDDKIIKQSPFFKMTNDGRVTYISSVNTPITFMTIHKSKGLEADNVILLNFQNAILGFPNKKSDDPILKLVLTKGEVYPFAEERRLLYVALTRTRNRAYVLVNQTNPSEFLHDFGNTKAETYQSPDTKQTESKTYIEAPAPKVEKVNVSKAETTNTYYKITPLSQNIVRQMNSRFIAIDFETSGLSPQFDRIIEIGAVIYENDKVTSQFETLVNPGFPISRKISELNHITNDMLRSAPDERIAVGKFVTFLGEAIKGKCVLCAHNAIFDAGFLAEALRRNGYNASLQFVDTLSISRSTIPGLQNYKLGTVAEYFGIVNNTSHNALSDAKVCGAIMSYLLPFHNSP